ncbi:MAG TPA: putative quinol monooxygenase [Pirellulales bacterium]|jgi:quinol monooxygenase YgiN
MFNDNERVIIAEVVTLPGKRDEFRKALDELILHSLAEEGVSTFRLHESQDQAGHFLLYERFRDDQSLKSHNATDHVAKILQIASGIAQDGKPKIAVYRILTD